MASNTLKLRVPVLLFLLGMVASVPAFSASAVIGSVAGSMNATVGGQALLPNTVLFSGDSLQVKDGVAVVAIGKASRMVFGHDTVASFLKESKDVTVLLSQGNVSLFHANDADGLRVKVGDVTVLPASGFKTFGEVASVNGAIMITAKEGSLLVDNNGERVNVAKGKTITISTRAARAPQGTSSTSASGGPKVSGGTALEVGALASGGTADVLAGIGLSRAGSARDSANAANTTAANAVTAASNAAAAAANAEATANAAGCALDTLAFDLGIPSPYVPPNGLTCP